MFEFCVVCVGIFSVILWVSYGYVFHYMGYFDVVFFSRCLGPYWLLVVRLFLYCFLFYLGRGIEKCFLVIGSYVLICFCLMSVVITFLIGFYESIKECLLFIIFDFFVFVVLLKCFSIE